MAKLQQPEPAAPLSPARRRRILEGAAAMFIRDGYEGASMAQIAAQAAVSKGTLYNYFPSKQALFAAFAREYCSRLVAEVFGDPEPDAAVAVALSRIGGRMLRTVLSAPGVTLFRVVVMEASKFPELAQAFMAAGPDAMVARMADWLRLQVAAGRLRVDDPVFAAEQFFALSQTKLVMRARADAAFIADDAQIERVVAGAVRVFLAAYGVDPG